MDSNSGHYGTNGAGAQVKQIQIGWPTLIACHWAMRFLDEGFVTCQTFDPVYFHLYPEKAPWIFTSILYEYKIMRLMPFTSAMEADIALIYKV